MIERELKVLVDAGAIKRVHIIADISHFYIEVEYPSGKEAVSTVTGAIRTWVSLDSAAKWVRKLGVGKSALDIESWQPKQKCLKID